LAPRLAASPSAIKACQIEFFGFRASVAGRAHPFRRRFLGGAAESKARAIRLANQGLKCHYNGIITCEALREMARPENRSEARSLSLTLPEETFNYLVVLAGLGKLGRTENEVATHILVRETYAMIERGFHERKIPPAAE
jgi:hypothetical protein